MHFSTSSLVLLAAASLTSALPSTSRRQTCSSTSYIDNGSFESGLTPWTAAGGARVVENNDTLPLFAYDFAATDGTHFVLLESSNNVSTSSITYNTIEGVDDNEQWTLSFDWRYNFASSTHGPPDIQCTLQSYFYDQTFTAQSWTRRSSNGGSGHVEETLSPNFGGSTLTIEFGCAGDSIDVAHDAGVLIDNVKFTPVC